MADKAHALRKARQKGQVKKLTDRRRFKVSTVASGSPARIAAKAVQKAGVTVFPEKVRAPNSDWVLKSGTSSAKIGGHVLVGHLKGAVIYTLTLEERATCPRTCSHWADCYGNNMQWADRWRHGAELERKLVQEVAGLCMVHGKVLIRLHILGDFYSQEYVRLWARLLDGLDNLWVFGFTAWGEKTLIGRDVAILRGVYPDRFMIRQSGRTGKFGSFTLPVRPDPDVDGGFPKSLGDAIVCPEQRDPFLKEPKERHCGSCSACWSCDAPICFVQH